MGVVDNWYFWSSSQKALDRSSKSVNIMALAGFRGDVAFEAQEKLYGRDKTRQIAWLDILKENICMVLEAFSVATQHAKQALLTC